MCSWFQFPSGNVTKCYPGPCGGGRQVALTWQVDQVVAQVARAPSAACSLRQVSTGPFPPVPSAPLALTPSVLTGNDSRGRSAFVKPKIPEFLEGGEVVAQRGHGPCWPCVCVCPACCYRPSCHHCCCSVAASMIGAKDCPCAWPLRTPRGLG